MGSCLGVGEARHLIGDAVFLVLHLTLVVEDQRNDPQERDADQRGDERGGQLRRFLGHRLRLLPRHNTGIDEGLQGAKHIGYCAVCVDAMQR
eukprot:954894-Prymnesium_polylepis.1